LSYHFCFFLLFLRTIQAALAHHNLGSFEESLKVSFSASALSSFFVSIASSAKRNYTTATFVLCLLDTSNNKLRSIEHFYFYFYQFLEAAKVQLIEMEIMRSSSSGGMSPVKGRQQISAEELAEAAEHVEIELDVDMYITICKGNVYQSCGDDEQALLQYLQGWDRAAAAGDQGKDWEMVCLNAVGMLAYFNIRYDIALKCFSAVAAYREEVRKY
jgi:hypothetical protein